jgi:hypothetical protein
MKIFGREPALIIGLLGSVLTTLAALSVPAISAGAAAAITAAVAALITAWATRPAMPALYTGAVTALAALLAQYGLHLSDQVVAGLSGTVLAVFALLARGQVEPAAFPARVPARSSSASLL